MAAAARSVRLPCHPEGATDLQQDLVSAETLKWITISVLVSMTTSTSKQCQLKIVCFIYSYAAEGSLKNLAIWGFPSLKSLPMLDVWFGNSEELVRQCRKLK